MSETPVDAAGRDAFVTRDAWGAGRDTGLPPVADAWPPASLDATAVARYAATIDAFDPSANHAYYAPQDACLAGDCGVVEACNDLDDDCDGRTDEGLTDCVVVACGAASCTGEPCCTDLTLERTYCGACSPTSWAIAEPCDGPEDCPAGTGCCFVSESDWVTIGCASRCAAWWRCHTAADCPATQPRCESSVCR